MKFFKNYKDVFAIMSGRRDRNMKINHKKGKSTNENRKKYFVKKGISENKIVSGLLHHTNRVVIINDTKELFISKTDALVTGKKGIYLSITNADCYPVFFFDPVSGVVGIAHAGWKGIVSNIIPNTIEKMIIAGADIENIRIAIGPGICHDCFEFGIEDAEKQFGKYYKEEYIATKLEGKLCISLSGIIFDQLIRSGVKYRKVTFSKECTHCESKFFSARRDNKGDTNKSVDAMISIIGMKAS